MLKKKLVLNFFIFQTVFAKLLCLVVCFCYNIIFIILAIDIWACGVIMLSILSGTQPFFRSPDDLTALAEITTLFGSNAMQQMAKRLGKRA